MFAQKQNQIRIFNDFSPGQRKIIDQLITVLDESTGKVIFYQDDPAINLYIVVEGEVHILFKPYDGPPIVVAHIKPEGVVGWSAALGSPVYTSSAICSTDCTLLRIKGEDLRSLYKNHPVIGSLLLEKLADIITERLHNTHGQVMALLEQGLHIKFQDQVELDQLSS